MKRRDPRAVLRLALAGALAAGFLASLPAGAAQKRGARDKKPPPAAKRPKPSAKPGKGAVPAATEDHVVSLDSLGIATQRYAKAGTNALGAAVFTGSVCNPTGGALENVTVEADAAAPGAAGAVHAPGEMLGTIRPGGAVPFRLTLPGLRLVGSWAITVKFRQNGEQKTDVFSGGVGDPDGAMAPSGPSRGGDRTAGNPGGFVIRRTEKTPPSDLLNAGLKDSKPVRFSALRADFDPSTGLLVVRGRYQNAGDIPLASVSIEMDCSSPDGGGSSFTIPLSDRTVAPGQWKDFSSKFPDSRWYADVDRVACQIRYTYQPQESEEGETPIEGMTIDPAMPDPPKPAVKVPEPAPLPAPDPTLPIPVAVPGKPGLPASLSYKASPAEANSLHVETCRLTRRADESYDVEGEIRNGTPETVETSRILLELLDGSDKVIRAHPEATPGTLAPSGTRAFRYAIPKPLLFKRFQIRVEGSVTRTKKVPAAATEPAGR